eukprot:CFRG3000T1
MKFQQFLTIPLVASAAAAVATSPSRRGVGSNAPSICNLAWSDSGNHGETDCSGSKYIFSSASSLEYSSRMNYYMYRTPAIHMCYLSVGTVSESGGDDEYTEDLWKLRWKRNTDVNSDGEYWGDYWFDPDDLVPKVLPIMKKILIKYRNLGYDMVSTDNAKPSSAVRDNDKQVRKYADKQRIDPRYVEYMEEIIEFSHHIGLKVALKNPEYYNNEDIISKFDAYIVESLFNWYPYDINLYTDLLHTSKPIWIFQYEGTNGVSNSKLRSRMRDWGIDMVYMDTSNGWEEFYS